MPFDRAQVTTRSTRSLPTRARRASGATHIDKSQAVSALCWSRVQRTIARSRPSSTATKVGSFASCFFQSSSVLARASSKVAPNASGASWSARRRIARNRETSCGPSCWYRIMFSRTFCRNESPDLLRSCSTRNWDQGRSRAETALMLPASERMRAASRATGAFAARASRSAASRLSSRSAAPAFPSLPVRSWPARLRAVPQRGCVLEVYALTSDELVNVGVSHGSRSRPRDPSLELRIELVDIRQRRRVDLVLRKMLARASA